MFDLPMTEEKVKNISPVTLAFVGDAVYSLYVREKLIKAGDRPLRDLQKASSEMVSAHGQSAFLQSLLEKFTEEEAAIFRRGRNAKKTTRAKSATVSEYNRSTGFEAVLGYLYLTGNESRIKQLLGESD